MRKKHLLFIGLGIILVTVLSSCGGRCEDGCQPGIYWDTVESTCSKHGYDIYVCPECNYETNRVELPLLEHTPNEDWERGYNPGCDHDGWDSIKCKICGYNVEKRVVEALGHDYTWKIDYLPNCIRAGKKTAKCSRCFSAPEEVIPALGHDWVTRAPIPSTCAEFGRAAGIQCATCNIWKEGGEQVAKLSHTPYDVAAIPATCTAAGKTAGTSCSVCQQIISGQSTVSALGHDFNVFTNACNDCSEKQLVEINSYNKFIDESQNLNQNFVIYLDKCMDTSDTQMYYRWTVKSGATHLRVVGTAGVTYQFCLSVEKRTDPLTIELVNTNLLAYSKWCTVDSISKVPINLTLYGTECTLTGGMGATGKTGGIITKGEKGGDGQCAISIEGDLTITVATSSATIKGGDGGKGGTGGKSTYNDANKGGNGGNGAHAIHASSITIKAAPGYSRANISISGGSGGAGGDGGSGDGLLYPAGPAGKPGNDATATNVSVSYQ